MKCPVCDKETFFVNGNVPYLWLGSYGTHCRAKTECGHYVEVTLQSLYKIKESGNQNDECDWGF
jgi:hypothetical protein